MLCTAPNSFYSLPMPNATYRRDLNLRGSEGSCGGNKGGDDSVLHCDSVVDIGVVD